MKQNIGVSVWTYIAYSVKKYPGQIYTIFIYQVV